MIYKFCVATGIPEYIAFAAGVTAIISSVAFNKYSEKKNVQLP
jgi:hypothetical protein